MLQKNICCDHEQAKQCLDEFHDTINNLGYFIFQMFSIFIR